LPTATVQAQNKITSKESQYIAADTALDHNHQPEPMESIAEDEGQDNNGTTNNVKPPAKPSAFLAKPIESSQLSRIKLLLSHKKMIN